VNACTHECMYVMKVHIHIYAHAHIHAHMHACIRIFLHASTFIHTPTCIRTCIHTLICFLSPEEKQHCALVARLFHEDAKQLLCYIIHRSQSVSRSIDRSVGWFVGSLVKSGLFRDFRFIRLETRDRKRSIVFVNRHCTLATNIYIHYLFCAFCLKKTLIYLSFSIHCPLYVLYHCRGASD
jgi:hypothetical protein